MKEDIKNKLLDILVNNADKLKHYNRIHAYNKRFKLEIDDIEIILYNRAVYEYKYITKSRKVISNFIWQKDKIEEYVESSKEIKHIESVILFRENEYIIKNDELDNIISIRNVKLDEKNLDDLNKLLNMN